MPKIKICGLTRPDDVKLSVQLGADLLGFVLAPSPRSITLKHLEDLTSVVPSTVLTVAVVVNPSKEEADEIMERADRIQFHGDESPEFCARYGRRGIKAFRIRDPEALEKVVAYESSVGSFLLDSFQQGVAGGTGHCFPWSYLEGQRFALPTFLAGGIKPNNIAEALRVKSVQGFDLSSGLEAAPGQKDPSLVQEFFKNFHNERDARCKP